MQVNFLWNDAPCRVWFIKFNDRQGWKCDGRSCYVGGRRTKCHRIALWRRNLTEREAVEAAAKSIICTLLVLHIYYKMLHLSGTNLTFSILLNNKVFISFSEFRNFDVCSNLIESRIRFPPFGSLVLPIQLFSGFSSFPFGTN